MKKDILDWALVTVAPIAFFIGMIGLWCVLP